MSDTATRGTWTSFRSLPGSVRLLVINQFGINLGFYMLMPYLANHLSSGLGMAAWTVGLVMGVRTLSQQGLFLLGGTLADRLGYRPMIIAGCALRTIGFALLGLVASLPALLVASVATGLAGALFNPAVRAYVAADAGERRVEAFAVFNVFYQAGILVGPLVGLALIALDFRVVCLTAAAIFAGLMVLQWLALPSRIAPADPERAGGVAGVLGDWRTVLANRAFLLFSLAMITSYVLSSQIYLALPLEASRVFGGMGDTGSSVLFAVSAVVAIAGQMRITAWAKARFSPGRSVTAGVALMSAAFLLLLLPTPPGAAALAPAAAATVVLTLGTVLAYPFEMDTIVTLSGGRLVATHYGFYNTLSGIGITVGNLATGLVWDAGQAHGWPWLVWAALAATGAVGTAALALLLRAGHLPSDPATEPDSQRKVSVR
ncbi:MFS transporter [Actinophytocola sp.]|uniref:MDR family MFS transporter n=1 Tax=Actinophytocola sp. TaxID=1872138 RepID=UPI002ED49045